MHWRIALHYRKFKTSAILTRMHTYTYVHTFTFTTASIQVLMASVVADQTIVLYERVSFIEA